MDQRITLEQKQVLHLTPQMRQSIKILQLNTTELIQWLEVESQDNPVLEVELSQVNEKDKDFKTEIPEESDLLFPYYANQKNFTSEKILTTEHGKDFHFFVSRNVTLHEHLLLNLNVVLTNNIDYKIGEYIIGNIDQNGYLGISCLEVARDLGITKKRARKILAMIQNCSIPGLGARSVRECLLLQLKYLKNDKKDLLRKLILYYLPELAKKNFHKVCKELNLSSYEVQQLLDIITKNLDPKPGRIFQQDSEINFLIPDIIIKKIDGKYEIIENKGYLPTIKINSFYKDILLEEKKDVNIQNRNSLYAEKGSEHQRTLKYLENKINSAHWIIRCVEQRRKTLCAITHFIIDYQRDFLEQGVTGLRPLSMKKVADSLGMNESTVSRAINEKKIQLPRGFYEMKFFFSKAFPQKWSEGVSNEKIKSLLKKYILLEDPYQPYSDQRLTDLLQNKENIKIARRTVTKYRKLLGIPSAKIRKRYKKQEKI